MQARIYQRPKNAMQSGRALTDQWVLDFVPAEARKPDPLMGWAGSSDTDRQVKLWFASKEEAIAFAEHKGFDYRIEEPHDRTIKPKSYADNFAFKRA